MNKQFVNLKSNLTLLTSKCNNFFGCTFPSKLVKYIKFPAFLSICLPPGFLPVLGPLERYMIPTLDAALLCSCRAGADLGRMSDAFEELLNEAFAIAFIVS